MRQADPAATSSRLSMPVRPSRLRAGLRLGATLLRASLLTQLEYPADFSAGLAVAALLSASDVVTFGAILWRFHAIGGWGPGGVAVLYGLSMGGYALHRLFAGDLHSLSDYVRSGDFDGLLLRPWPPLFALICRSGRVGQFANLAVPAAALVWGCERLLATGALPAWGPAVLAGVLLCGTALQYAVAIATHAAAFWIVRADELSVLTVNAPNTAAQYPLTAFPGWLRDYLVGVVPVGLCVFYPVRFLIGRGGGWPDVLCAPAAAAVALAAALALWRHGERRYMGTGT